MRVIISKFLKLRSNSGTVIDASKRFQDRVKESAIKADVVRIAKLVGGLKSEFAKQHKVYGKSIKPIAVYYHIDIKSTEDVLLSVFNMMQSFINNDKQRKVIAGVMDKYAVKFKEVIHPEYMKLVGLYAELSEQIGVDNAPRVLKDSGFLSLYLLYRDFYVYLSRYTRSNT